VSARFVRFFAAALLLCAAGLGLTGCSTVAAKRQPDTLVVVYTSDANTLNPLFANNEPAFLFYYFIFEGLIGVGPNFSVTPALATSWSSTPDHLHWDVSLRRGVKWSDGAPFDSRDVVFTWKTMLDPQVAFPYAGSFSYVKRVTARGPARVHFDLSEPNVLFVSQGMYLPILPEHILGKISAAAQRVSSFGQHPIGTGPYMLESWHHDDTVAFVRNPRWWHRAAKIRKLEFRIVLNNNARVDAMVDGSGDLYPSMVPADYRTLREIAPRLMFYNVPDLFSRFILSNDTLPGLDELAVRQGMMYGWDRRAVADGLYHGNVIINNSLTPWALSAFHNDNVTLYAYDPARARALLDASGWRIGPDGVRRRGSVRLAFILKLPTGSSSATEVCAAFQADMRAIGVAIEIQQLDYATFIDQTNNFQYQLAFTGWGGTPDPDEFTFLDSSQIVPAGNNETGYRNARVDRDLRSGRKTFDPAARKAIYDDYQRVTGATLPVLWGFDEKFSVAYSSRVRIDQRVALPDYYFFWNVYDWSLTS
jgi:peptide/nickel transport system substrate-binding protein